MAGLMPAPEIIVPVWNGRDLLLKLLDSISRQTCRVADVLVIDNGSTDDAAAVAEKWGARVVRMGRNAGFAAAVNRGVAESRSEWLAILNSDVELEPDWLEALMDAGPDWFASGKIVSARQPDTIDGSWDLVCRGGCAWRAGEGRSDGELFRAKRVIAIAPFTAVLVRAELFQRMGNLDERFESYLEDVDFGLRCAAAGYAGVYVPGAVCRHWGSATLGRWDPETARRIARNQLFLVAKHYPERLWRRWWWAILMAQGLWGLVAVRHGSGWGWLRGKVEGLRKFPSMAVGNERMESLLIASERELFAAQKASGFDLYWRLYFALVGQSDTRPDHG